jgi:hypothetical protein
MNSAKVLMPRDQELLSSPQFAQEYYRELTRRNRHFVDSKTQERLQSLRVLIAGCGAGGGACTQPLARLGVTQFRLTDNGYYEISNLNRQHCFSDHIGENKAEYHARQILRINPYADVQADPRGIRPDNVEALVAWADIVIDAVDVTNPESIQMKFLLHEIAKKMGKPVLSPLDPGLCQYGQTYDYRDPQTLPLHGRLEACKRAHHPMKALFSMFSVDDLPSHTLPLLNDLLNDSTQPASQLAVSADLLSGVVGSAMIRYAETGELISGWYLNLESLAYSWKKRIGFWTQSFRLRSSIKRRLAALE